MVTGRLGDERAGAVLLRPDGQAVAIRNLGVLGIQLAVVHQDQVHIPGHGDLAGNRDIAFDRIPVVVPLRLAPIKIGRAHV